MSDRDSSAHEDPKIGRALELARKERGLSLKEVEEATKIRAGYLAELELENFDMLPAIYVQGFLRTYANFLHLDADAMVRELKRRQGPGEEPPLYVGPAEDDSLDDILAALGGASEAKGRDTAEDDEDERPALLPAGIISYLYLASAVVLVLALAVLALTVAGDERPTAVSQVREPLTSRAPETSPPDAGEEDRARSPEQEKVHRTDEKEEAGSETGNGEDERTEQASRTGQDRDDPRPVRKSASATASAAPERDTGRRASAEPPRRDSAPQNSPAPQSSPRPAGQPGGAPSGGSGSPPPRNDGEIEVRVAVGARDPVQLTGGPFDD